MSMIDKNTRDERTYRIIGSAMEVCKELGPGFLEAVYQEAMERELSLQAIPYRAQPSIRITYKGKALSKIYQPDFVCFEEIVVEIKALKELSGQEEAQMINYLKASHLKIGLLINFGSKSLEYKRFIHNP